MLLGILCVIVLCIFYFHFRLNHFLSSFPKKALDEFAPKTGDIILTRCDYAVMFEPIHYSIFNLFNFYAGGYETHAGIVIVLDKPMIFHVEYAPSLDEISGTYKWKAPVLMELTDYIMRYIGDVFYYSASSALNQEASLQFMNKMSKKEFTINQLKWANTIFKLPIKTSDEYIFCTQMVCEYLKALNVIKLDFDSAMISPRDIKKCLSVSGFYDSGFIVLNSYAQKKNELTFQNRK